ncbi:MAG: HNH endonuclease [Candidatus Peribacteraceae bacterium]|nr:HNH endonuclease [Candidatus Peribacteraceae bacterium]
MLTDCPACTSKKDSKAAYCHSCRMKYNHPRETGNWGVNKKSGYLEKRINGIHYYQHRYVMEEELGRPLLSSEHIHHIDGDKTNNDIINLEILTNSKHRKHHATPERMKELSILGHKARWGVENATNI